MKTILLKPHIALEVSVECTIVLTALKLSNGINIENSMVLTGCKKPTIF